MPGQVGHVHSDGRRRHNDFTSLALVSRQLGVPLFLSRGMTTVLEHTGSNPAAPRPSQAFLPGTVSHSPGATNTNSCLYTKDVGRTCYS
jgi:hypothetical protein